MRTTDLLRLAAVVLATLTLGGCFSFKGEIPSVPSWGEPPPAGTIVTANPNSKPDVVRENQQLRDRVAWLEHQIQGRQNKVQKLQREQADIQREIDKLNGDLRKYK